MLFKNRVDAGEKLAEKLKQYKNAVILAIPRGGVETALPIAKKMGAPLGIIVARKITVPQYPEVAIGAVTPDGSAVYNEAYVRELGIGKAELRAAEKEAKDEALRREKTYTAKTQELIGKNVILVDDGLATGYTVLAAMKSVKKRKPKSIVAAVPVASANAFALVEKECRIVSLHVSDGHFFAVGAFYENFPQLSDEDVMSILKKANEKG